MSHGACASLFEASVSPLTTLLCRSSQLDKIERTSFLDWRRNLASLQETSGSKSLTPFEKNLNVWRQLWRVTERSDVVLQIVDARNPLFYISMDLRVMVEEEMKKRMIIVINKSDYLTMGQRKEWGRHLDEKGIEAVFFSAWEQQREVDDKYRRERLDEEAGEGVVGGEGNNDVDDVGTHPKPPPPPTSTLRSKDPRGVSRLLDRSELLAYLKSAASSHGVVPNPRYDGRVQYGTVGFPNVGKSSLINVLLGSATTQHNVHRVGVASQPGKTKHFQTLHVPGHPDAMLCDCPGLVFPSFVSSTADMIAAGVYPIAQMRDHWPVVGLVCQRVPRTVLNATYGINIPVNLLEGHDPLSPPPKPTAEELLTTYCVARSIIASGSGVPDWQRAARIVVKDYVAGRLLYCHAPPGAGEDFERETQRVNLEIGGLKGKFEEAQDRVEREEEGGGVVSDDGGEVGDDDNDGLDILEFMEGGGVQDEPAENGGKRGKAHKSMRRQKWGKKGRKQRDKDPYGCHDDGINKVLADGAGIVGVGVSAGRRGRKAYVRPSYTPKGAAELAG